MFLHSLLGLTYQDSGSDFCLRTSFRDAETLGLNPVDQGFSNFFSDGTFSHYFQSRGTLA